MRRQQRRVEAEPCGATWGPRVWGAAVAPAEGKRDGSLKTVLEG